MATATATTTPEVINTQQTGTRPGQASGNRGKRPSSHSSLQTRDIGSCGYNGRCITSEMAMADGHAEPAKKQKTRLPPKRGQIKMNIIQKFVNMVSKVVSKAMGVSSSKKRRKEGKVIAEEVKGQNGNELTQVAYAAEGGDERIHLRKHEARMQ
ncbi:hypothetical protein L1049_007688 [Liquidambar formosana]|uniref:Uncharacterized protein n=1 Tax=Liquidambar formosana TaxID=63359 RepID=A0AAP0S1Y8_LIQFO